MFFGLIGEKTPSKPANLLSYNPITWIEWITSPANKFTADISGLEITATNGSNEFAYLVSNFAPNLNYGLLYNTVSSNITGSWAISSTSAFNSLTLENIIGNKKVILTSKSIITDNTIRFILGSNNSTSTKIKIKNIRVFYLPVGSQILSDFNTLTPDQLDIKYPY